MKLLMIGAGIIALTGLNVAIASPQFNQSTHSLATAQLVADQDGTTQPADQNTNPDMNQDQAQTDQNANPDMNEGQANTDQNTPAQPTQNNNGVAPTADQPPAVSVPAAPAEQPVPSQPDQNS